MRCGMCGGRTSRLPEGYLCSACGYLSLSSGRVICPACYRGDCLNCESEHEERCDHECFLQSYYGPPYNIGFITADDW